jgi:hypothetical protein
MNAKETEGIDETLTNSSANFSDTTDVLPADLDDITTSRKDVITSVQVANILERDC